MKTLFFALCTDSTRIFPEDGPIVAVAFHSPEIAETWVADHEHQGPFAIYSAELLDDEDGTCSECDRKLVADTSAWMCTCGRRYTEDAA